DVLRHIAPAFTPVHYVLSPPDPARVRQFLGPTASRDAAALRDALAERGDLASPMIVALVPLIEGTLRQSRLTPDETRRGHLYAALAQTLLGDYSRRVYRSRQKFWLTANELDRVLTARRLLGLIATRMVAHGTTQVPLGDAARALRDFRRENERRLPEWWPSRRVGQRLAHRSDDEAVVRELLRTGVFQSPPGVLREHAPLVSFLHESLRDQLCAEDFLRAAEPPEECPVWECWERIRQFESDR